MLSEEETPFVSYVIPLYTFLNYSFMSPFKFVFDLRTKTFRFIPGAIVKKVVCVLVLCLVLIHGLAVTSGLQKSARSQKLSVMMQMMNILYYMFNCAFAYSIFVPGLQICQIFTQLQECTHKIGLFGGSLPSTRRQRRKIRGISCLMIAIAAAKASQFALMAADGHSEFSILPSLDTYLKTSVEDSLTKIIYGYCSSCSEDYSRIRAASLTKDVLPKPLVILFGLLCVYIQIITAYYWVMAYLLISLWSLLFCNVFQSYFDSLSADEEGKLFYYLYPTNRKETVLKDIKHFMGLTEIIHKFNQATGLTTLFCVLSCIGHCSTEILRAYETHSFWQIFAIVSMLLMFGVQLILGARVNALASKIVTTIKLRYQDEFRWKKQNGESYETTQLMLILLHEVKTRRIGVAGLGFFTITYSFISSMLSAILTYGLVVLQFKKGDQHNSTTVEY